MAKPDEPYRKLIVESYYPASTSGRKGKVHIRPLPGQWADPSLSVECSKELSDLSKYQIGSQENSGEYIYSSFRWEHKFIK